MKTFPNTVVSRAAHPKICRIIAIIVNLTLVITVVNLILLKMSCYSFVDQYANENEEEKRENVLSAAVDCLQKQDERRTQDLFEFINDFVSSEEYLDYVAAKRKIMRRCTATQCYENDIVVEVREKYLIDKYPLTEEQRKMYAFKEQFEKYAERQRQLQVRKKQEKDIQSIMEKINAAKIMFECTKESRQRAREKKDERLLQHYSTKLGINLSEFTPKSRARILERVKSYHRVICTRRDKKRQSFLTILERLLFEHKMKKAIQFQSKTSYYKVKRREKIIKDMEVVGTKIELVPRHKITQVPEEPKVEEEPPLGVEEKNDKKKKTGKEKDKKEKKEKKDKKETKAKDKKTAKEKKEKGKKKEKAEAKLELPYIPIVNPREKFIPENIDQMLDLVEEFRNLDNELENREMLEERNKHYILGDTGVESKPDTILFQNYDEGKTYSKTIVISNVSSEARKIRFVKFSFENEYDEVVFDVENFGIKKLFIGCHAKFSLKFQPYDSFKSYKGKMVFLSYNVRRCQYYQFDLDVKCLPKYSDLQIYPKTVDFGRMPVWTAKNYQNYKFIRIQNKGAKCCIIYIHKIPDPLDLEVILDKYDDHDDNKENIQPVPKNSITSVQAELECIEDTINSCIDNVDNNFYFEESFFTLHEFKEKRIRVFFKNADYVGNYFERFTVDVYEKFQYGDFDVVGCQEITLLAETTGHFLSVVPEILDFGICQINSCYQLDFEIFNSSTHTQAVSMRFPSNIADMVHSDLSAVYLPPQGKRAMWVKLLPREYIYKDSCIYYDKSTSILEFPIHIYIVSKNYQDYPPAKVAVYAILTTTEDMTIMTNPKCSLSNFLDTILVDLKSCSIYETILAEFFLQNNTAVTQVCGFFDLPQCVTLEPNCGFVKLSPNQRKKIKLYLSPEIRDFPSFAVGTLRNNKYFFKLRIDTISNIGQTKKEINPRRLKNSVDMMCKELLKKESGESSMLGFVDALKKEMVNEFSQSMVNKGSNVKIVDSELLKEMKAATVSGTSSVFFNKILFNLGTDLREMRTDDNKYESNKDENISFYDTILNYQNFVIVETNSRKVIWCKATLKRPLIEFSHQAIEFPDTPCGSYSVLEIQLHAIEKEMELDCGSLNKRKRDKLDFTATFKIMGNSQEISVEPKCGTLRSGASMKITLLAKPNVPQEIIAQTAKSIKCSEIYEMKLKEFQASRAKKAGKKDKEGKGKKEKGKDKKNKSKESEETKKDTKSKKTDASNKKKNDKKNKGKEAASEQEPPLEEVPDFVITDKELECDYLDLYPAEMVYWRNLDPYYISAKFTCRVDYQCGSKMVKKPDLLYLDATCKVTRPDFITSLNLQRLDFGKCIIGMSTKKEIMLQNIKYDDIKVKTTLLNPVGCFSIPFIKNVMIPPEHSLKLPIDFIPEATDKVTQYVEIRSDATVLPLILCGEGILPNINITPDFTVFRLETKQNRLAELHLKIENASESPVNIRVEKLFEIEGRIGDFGKEQKQEVTEEGPKDSKKNKKGKTKEKLQAKDKGPKYSDSLTDRELQTIDACFSTLKGDSHFELSNTEKCINIESNSHHTLTAFFGEPELLQKRKIEKPKKGKKEKGENKKANAEAEETESRNSGEKKKNSDIGKQFITQYNVFVGKTFIKSLVLICTKL